MQIFTSFYERQLKEEICYSFTLLISDLMVFSQFKMGLPDLLGCIKFPNFYDTNAIFPNSTGPWLQKSRKTMTCYCNKTSDWIKFEIWNSISALYLTA